MLSKASFGRLFHIFVGIATYRKMKNIIILLCMSLVFSSCGTQKVKGSRNVITERTDLKDFSSVEIQGDFEVSLQKGRQASMEVRADDNLHSIIQAEVSNNTLYIKPTKTIKRSKALEIKVSFPQTLEHIKISGKTELYSEEDLYLEDFELRINDKSKVWLTLTTRNFRLYQQGKAKTEMNLTAENAYFQLNGSSDLEALINAPFVKIDTYEKASADIEGETENFELRTEHSTKFDGRKFTAKKASITAEGRSENRVEVLENLVVIARDNSSIQVYGDPKIEMLEFTESAKISKKE